MLNSVYDNIVYAHIVSCITLHLSERKDSKVRRQAKTEHAKLDVWGSVSVL